MTEGARLACVQTPRVEQLDPMSGVVTIQRGREIIVALAEAGLLYATKDRTWRSTVIAAVAQEGVEAEGWVTWALAGQCSGHEWHACDQCGQLRLQGVKEARPRSCNMTPRCRGHMRRLAPRPILTAAIKQALSS